MQELEAFRRYLERRAYSRHTIESYLRDLDQFGREKGGSLPAPPDEKWRRSSTGNACKG